MSVALLVLAAACAAAVPLPEGDAYVRALVGAQVRREEALSRYSYDVSEVVEDLDRSGAVRKRRSRDFEVFMVKGRPVQRLVAKDGRPLSGREREQEERRVRKLADAVAAGKTASELPGVRLAKLLERYRFVATAREEIAGRCAVAFDFAALPGDFKIDYDGVMRRLAGKLWVDEEERAVARVEVRNTSDIKIALGLAVKVSSLALSAEFTRLETSVWLPRSVETLVIGRKLLVSGLRVRRVASYSNYRRFEVDVEEEMRDATPPDAVPPPELW
ncbi:MAG TPA: hypothetical protein VIJ10_14730 [Vicinamibacteria bacterium]